MNQVPVDIADLACLRPARRGFAQAGIAECGIKLKTREFHNIPRP